LDADHEGNKKDKKKQCKEKEEELRKMKDNGTFPEYANMLASLY
jgi:hypothetical protein